VDVRLERTLDECDILFIGNSVRLRFANGVEVVRERGIAPELAARLVVRVIESLVAGVQRRYAVITRAHCDIRKTLLDPK
jgi:hypothetical protein